MASIDRIMIEDEAVTNLMRELQAGLASSGLELEGRHAVAAYIGAFDAVRRPRSYNHVPKAVGDMIGAIETAAGPSAVEDYHRLVLLTLIQQFDQRATACRLPPRLRDRSIDFLAESSEDCKSRGPGIIGWTRTTFKRISPSLASSFGRAVPNMSMCIPASLAGSRCIRALASSCRPSAISAFGSEGSGPFSKRISTRA